MQNLMIIQDDNLIFLLKVIADFAQQDAWKTKDGRKTQKCRARLCIQVHSRSWATFFLYSAVVSLPAVLLGKVSINTDDDNLRLFSFCGSYENGENKF